MTELRDEIKKLREDFLKGTLSEREVHINPFNQFELWLAEAVKAQINEVQAMVLSTVSLEGKPSSRIVYLREFDNNAFLFYTNFNSKKSRELKNNPNACLNFFWPDLERQIRIEGTVELAEEIFSDRYFNNRPYDSKVGSWASNQSSIIKSREELETEVEKFKKQFTENNITRPAHWGGWKFTANYYEFWQGRKSRLHDRISYTLNKDQWIIERLAP